MAARVPFVKYYLGDIITVLLKTFHWLRFHHTLNCKPFLRPIWSVPNFFYHSTHFSLLQLHWPCFPLSRPAHFCPNAFVLAVPSTWNSLPAGISVFTPLLHFVLCSDIPSYAHPVVAPFCRPLPKYFLINLASGLFYFFFCSLKF